VTATGSSVTLGCCNLRALLLALMISEGSFGGLGLLMSCCASPWCLLHVHFWVSGLVQTCHAHCKLHCNHKKQSRRAGIVSEWHPEHTRNPPPPRDQIALGGGLRAVQSCFACHSCHYQVDTVHNTCTHTQLRYGSLFPSEGLSNPVLCLLQQCVGETQHQL